MRAFCRDAYLQEVLMTASVDGVLSGANRYAYSDTAAQVAALRAQLAAAQKQLAAAIKQGTTQAAATTQLRLSQTIAAIQMQIAQLQQAHARVAVATAPQVTPSLGDSSDGVQGTMVDAIV